MHITFTLHIAWVDWPAFGWGWGWRWRMQKMVGVLPGKRPPRIPNQSEISTICFSIGAGPGRLARLDCFKSPSLVRPFISYYVLFIDIRSAGPEVAGESREQDDTLETAYLPLVETKAHYLIAPLCQYRRQCRLLAGHNPYIDIAGHNRTTWAREACEGPLLTLVRGAAVTTQSLLNGSLGLIFGHR